MAASSTEKARQNAGLSFSLWVDGGSPQPAAEQLAPGVAELVARLDLQPTYVTGRRWDILAANRAARTLWTDWPALPQHERNLLLWMFAAPKTRSIFVEWEKEEAAQLGRFRAAATRHLGDRSFTELIERLHDDQPAGARLVATPRHRPARDIADLQVRRRHNNGRRLDAQNVSRCASSDQPVDRS